MSGHNHITQCYLLIMNAWGSLPYVSWANSRAVIKQENVELWDYLPTHTLGGPVNFATCTHVDLCFDLQPKPQPQWYTLFTTLSHTHTYTVFTCSSDVFSIHSVRMYESLHWQLHYFERNEKHWLVISLSNTLWMGSICFNPGHYFMARRRDNVRMSSTNNGAYVQSRLSHRQPIILYLC